MYYWMKEEYGASDFNLKKKNFVDQNLVNIAIVAIKMTKWLTHVVAAEDGVVATVGCVVVLAVDVF